MMGNSNNVIPAQAGIQRYALGADVSLVAADAAFRWIPAYAGMTGWTCGDTL
jgi:hypothetical protein